MNLKRRADLKSGKEKKIEREEAEVILYARQLGSSPARGELNRANSHSAKPLCVSNRLFSQCGKRTSLHAPRRRKKSHQKKKRKFRRRAWASRGHVGT